MSSIRKMGAVTPAPPISWGALEWNKVKVIGTRGKFFGNFQMLGRFIMTIIHVWFCRLCGAPVQVCAYAMPKQPVKSIKKSLNWVGKNAGGSVACYQKIKSPAYCWCFWERAAGCSRQCFGVFLGLSPPVNQKMTMEKIKSLNCFPGVSMASRCQA